jgi:pimeloyl-ACP methyl ester carboxylesterase
LSFRWCTGNRAGTGSAKETTMGTPVLFIHGLWLHASSWDPWIEVFRGAGYDPQAPGWPGDGDTVADSRRDPDAIADHGIDDVVAHFAQIVDALPASPILIGHSFGGLIAQKLLGQDRARAAVAIDAAQIKGVLPVPLSALRATLPVFKNPANKHRSVSLTAGQFRFAFANAVSEESRTSCTSVGRSRRRDAPSSRRPRPTSIPTPPPRSTRPTRTADLSC